MQASLYFYGRSVALQAAREGVSQLRLEESGTACESNKEVVAASTAKYATTVGSGALNSAKVSPTCQYNSLGNSTVTVQVSGHAISLLGFTLSINESASGRVEQFQNYK